METRDRFKPRLKLAHKRLPSLQKFDFKTLAASWPSGIVARSEVGRFSGGVITPSYLANQDSQAKGPRNRLRIGRKVAYPVQDLVRWLEARSTDLDI